MKAAEEKEGTGGSDGKDEKSMAEPTTATTKLDEREEGEVEEEASTMKPATNMNGEKDKDGAPAAKRQKLDDFMAKDSSNNSIIDSSSLLNICQPAFTSISKKKTILPSINRWQIQSLPRPLPITTMPRRK